MASLPPSLPPRPHVIFTSPQWLVVSKPSGWFTIPGRGSEKVPVLKDWVVENHGPIWVVHRLDRDTSGIVLFARTGNDHRKANLWFQSRKIKKVYHCLAGGKPSSPVLKIQTPIEGSPSLTQIEVLDRFSESGVFLARVLPLTGRRHQIRIHLSSKGYPILGDVEYQGLSQISQGHVQLNISRVALHASSLTLPDGEVFSSPFPDDFQNWIEQLKKGNHL